MARSRSSRSISTETKPAMAMACRTLELTLLSASDLRGVNLVSKMEVYAVVYLAGDPRARQRVATDRAGGRNPSWKDNATVRLAVPASGAGSGALRVLLRAERAGLGGDRDVGEVIVPLPDVLAGAGDGPTAAAMASYPVRKVGSSKTTHGVLNLSYKLGGVVHPDPAAAAAAAACSCKPAAPAAGGPTLPYLAAEAAAYRAAPPPPPPLYGYRQLPAIPQPVAPMGAVAGAGGRGGR